MPSYDIKTLSAVNSISDIQWQNITTLEIAKYPWYKSGLKQKTAVKLCSCANALYLQFIVQDSSPVAKQSQLNHMKICEDSCVEFFFSPSGVLGSDYINFEVNCIGAMHLAYGPTRNEREFISPELANEVLCHSIKTTNGWVMEITLPYFVIEQIIGSNINRTLWHANFYRCGGEVSPQYATWSAIDAENPDFHRPEFFAPLYFK